MKTYDITIIGMGQRGLTVLERIAALLLHEPIDTKLNIHVIDEATPGQGIHDSHQPDHLLINTIAAQVAIYHDTSVVGGGPLVPGMTFLEWLQNSGYRSVNGKILLSSYGEEINENTYVSRALLGAYLTWGYDRIVESLPPSVKVITHGRTATNVVRTNDGSFIVELEGGYRITSDFVFLATGHSGCAPTPWTTSTRYGWMPARPSTVMRSTSGRPIRSGRSIRSVPKRRLRCAESA